MCNGCPFNSFSEEALHIQNLGCLPTPKDMWDRHLEKGEAISCHEKQGIACKGLSEHVDVSKDRVIAYSDWYNGV